MRRLLMGAFVALGLANGIPAFADTLPGVIAYDAGEYEKARPLLEQEAASGDPAAQTKLGLIHAKGLGVARDPKLARQWFDKAAAQGHAEAEYCVGVTYDFGDGVEKDPAAAATWYRKAAEKGYDKAQYNLGAMHYEGLGVEKDLTAAADWFLKAAEQDHPDAQFWLARLYLSNDGLEPNMLTAKMWMDRAAKNSEDAKKGKDIIDKALADMLREKEMPTLAGGDGSSIEDAISFPEITSNFIGVESEYKVIRLFMPGWQRTHQALLNEDGYLYDVLTLTKDGKERSVYFDISNWFGKM